MKKKTPVTWEEVGQFLNACKFTAFVLGGIVVWALVGFFLVDELSPISAYFLSVFVLAGYTAGIGLMFVGGLLSEP